MAFAVTSLVSLFSLRGLLKRMADSPDPDRGRALVGSGRRHPSRGGAARIKVGGENGRPCPTPSPKAPP